MSRNSYGRRDHKGGETLLGRLFSLLLLSVTIASCVALIISFIAPYFASTHSWVFPLFGLIAPAIYIFNVVLALYFIICWRWRMALPVIALLLLGSGRISLFVKVPITKDYGTESFKGGFKLMSYNVRGFNSDNRKSSVDHIVKYIEESKLDVICLQEYEHRASDFHNKISKLRTKYNGVTYGTNAIYSRYPIVGQGDLFEQADSLGGRSIYADLLIRGDTIRIINNHLNTNSIQSEDKSYLRPEKVIRDSMRTQRLGGIVRKFRLGSIERMTQVSVIRNFMKSTPYRYASCGDFNDAPISFAYFELSRGMTDAFVACGEGYTYTYRGFSNLLRIDYILTSKGITPMSYSTHEEQTMSDHLPITAYLKIDKENKK